MASASATRVVEQCWTLVGQRRGRIWLGRRVCSRTGERTRVRFDGPWVLQREERHGDVIGFLHTHPDGPHEPSARDLRTMRAWCSAFGKPLLCLIKGQERLAGYLFTDETREALALVEMFPRGVIIGVQHGGQVSS